MQMSLLKALGCVLAGMALMGIIVWLAMPSIMLVRHKSNRGYAETIAVLSHAIGNKPDWRVLTLNDYQKSTAAFAKLEHVGSITICNPHYASTILANDADRGVTALMPLGIGVYEDKARQVYVTQLNVGLMGMMFGGTIADVMGAAGKDIDGAIASVTAK